jgi:hypothetical protein
MRKKFVATTQDINTPTVIESFIATPPKQSGVQKAAAALEAGMQAYGEYQKRELKSEVEQQASDYINPPELQQATGALSYEAALREQSAGLLDLDEEREKISRGKITQDDFNVQVQLSNQEVALIAEARRQSEVYRKAYEQKRISPAMFKANVEKTIKQYANRAPWITTELHKISSSVLGKDYSSYSIQHALAADESAAASEAKMNEFIYKEIFKDNPYLLDGQGTIGEQVSRALPRYSQLKYDKELFDRNSEKYKFNKEVGADNYKRDLRKAMPSFLVQPSNELNSLMGKDSITQQDLAALSVKQKALFASALEQKKQAAITKIKGAAPAGVEETYLNSQVTALTAQYDEVIQLVHGKRMLDQYKLDNELRVAEQENMIVSNKSFASFAAMLKMIPPGTSLHASVQRQHSSTYKEIAEFLDTSNGVISPTSAINHQTALTPQEKEVKKRKARSVAKERWETYKQNIRTGNDVSNVSEEFNTLLRGYTAFGSSNPNAIEMNDMDMVFDFAKDKEFIDVVSAVDNPALRQQISDASTSYLNRVVAAMETDLEEDYDKAKAHIVLHDNGTVEFVREPYKYFKDPETGREVYQTQPILDAETLKNLNDTYGKRLTNLVRSTAHIDGSTKYGVYNQLITRKMNLLAGETAQPNANKE